MAYLYGSKYEKLQEIEVQEFFERFVIEPSTCWLWSGRVDKDGYGIFSSLGRSGRAHRISWVYFNRKPIPANRLVMHSCDTPGCVNPGHLSLGTHKRNAEDRASKNRSARHIGELSGTAKLTAEDILAIRNSRESSRLMAMKYPVSDSSIRRIRRGQRWAHLVTKSEKKETK